jgi:hypothetical protein
MSEFLQNKEMIKENGKINSISKQLFQENNIQKYFPSEEVSTFPNSNEHSKEVFTNSLKLKSVESQQKTLNKFMNNNYSINNESNKNMNQNINPEHQIAKDIIKDLNNKEKKGNEEKQSNLEKYENLFLSKKRLMKKRDVILKNKLLKKIAKNYFDKEADLGSDNEDHDDIIKKVYHSDSDSEKENDKNGKDLDDLIDNEENENYIQNKKYFDDMLEKDHDEILKVIEGPKKRIIKDVQKKIMVEDNGLSLRVRMERMNDINILKEEEEDNNEENKFKKLENKLKELKKQSNEDEMNEELKEMIEINNNKIMKQINIITGQQNKIFRQHLQDNKEILKNVIQNDDEDSSKKESTKNEIIVKGNGAAKLGNKKFRPFCGMGKFGNCKNSLLNHIKKEKNINKLDSNGLKKHNTSFHNNLKLNSNNEMRYTGNLNDILVKK